MAEHVGKRQRFINCVNRNLERVLHVNEQQEESSTTTVLYEDDFERFFKVQRSINEIRRLLLLVPRGLRTRLHNCEPLQRIREALTGLRLDQLPGELLDQLNELNLL